MSHSAGTSAHDIMRGSVHIYARTNASEPTKTYYSKDGSYEGTCAHAPTHTLMGQTCKWTHWDWEKDSPLAKEPIPSNTPTTTLHPPDPCHRQSASQSNTLKLSLSACSSPHHPLTHTISPMQSHTHTHEETWRVPCLTPGPRWSLVWRPVCVCLASNGPFKCRIFTADRAILGDSAHWGLNMLGLHYPGGSYPYYHHTTPHWLTMR